MDRGEILGIFSRLEYQNDERDRPDERRRGQFRAGWQEAVDGEVYADATLSKLTWHNAGYRYGKILKAKPVELVDNVFDVLADAYDNRAQPRKIPRELTRELILAAAKEIDEHGHAFGESTKFDIIIDGKRYPPKALVGVAASLLTEEPYGPSDFSSGFGGSQAIGVLKSLEAVSKLSEC